MKDLDQVELPEDIRYTSEHVWLRMDGEAALVGISDFAQDQLGEIAFVDLPAEGTHFKAGEEFGTVESIKSVSPLYMPVSGTVRTTNNALEDAPTLVNVEPYTEGWMVCITPDSTDDAAGMQDAAAYRALLAQNA